MKSEMGHSCMQGWQMEACRRACTWASCQRFHTRTPLASPRRSFDVPQKEGCKLVLPNLQDVYGSGNWAFGGGWLGCAARRPAAGGREECWVGAERHCSCRCLPVCLLTSPAHVRASLLFLDVHSPPQPRTACSIVGKRDDSSKVQNKLTDVTTNANRGDYRVYVSGLQYGGSRRP